MSSVASRDAMIPALLLELIPEPEQYKFDNSDSDSDFRKNEIVTPLEML